MWPPAWMSRSSAERSTARSLAVLNLLLTAGTVRAMYVVIHAKKISGLHNQAWAPWVGWR